MRDEPANDDTNLELQITGVAPHPEPDGNMRVLIATTRRELRAVLHPSPASPGGVIYAGGALGGFDGPSGLYPRLGDRLRPRISGLRLHYRLPNEFGECVVDILAGVSFLRGIGADRVALVGHSFGGAVVIKAGELSPHVLRRHRAVVTDVRHADSRAAGEAVAARPRHGRRDPALHGER